MIDARYLQVARRHKLLLAAPVVVTVVLALWTVLGAAPTYLSSSSILVDNPAPSQSAQIDNSIAVRTPADTHQLVLQELLGTRSFRMNVAKRGGLADYLAKNKPTGSGPVTLLMRLVKKPGPLDERIVAAVAPGKVSWRVLGPRVLSVSYAGPTPELASSTLKALLDEYGDQSASALKTQAEAAKTYYQGLMNAAADTAATAQKNLADYVAGHPGLLPTDPSLTVLTESSATASAALSDARKNFSQSDIALANLPSSRPTVVDAPTVPTSHTGGKKMLVMALFGGLFAGGLISVLGLLALTATDKTLRAERERRARDLLPPDAIVPAHSVRTDAYVPGEIQVRVASLASATYRPTAEAGALPSLPGSEPAEQVVGADPSGATFKILRPRGGDEPPGPPGDA